MTRTSGSLAIAYINTSQSMILYRKFIIQESWGSWEWTHEDYAPNGITGDCQTMFECIDAVDEWYENKAAD